MKEFIKTRSIGFFLAAASILFSLLNLILYIVYFMVGEGSQYASLAALLLLIGSIVCYIPLSYFKKTERIAVLLEAILLFLSFLFHIYSSYRYFTEVFYGGFNMNSLGMMNSCFLCSYIFYVLSLILSQISVYMKQSKDMENVRKEETL